MHTLSTQPLISIVLPVFNEAAGIQTTIATLEHFVSVQPERFELIFVDDGSTDDSLAQLQAARQHNPNLKIVQFARNFGHQLAISAGLREAHGDAVIVMDADLQDPPSVIPSMIAKWQAGAAVVYGQRRHRSGETWFKKASAAAFYRLLKAMTNTDIPVDTGDFRLMDRRVVNVLKSMNESDPYVRGMVAWVGFDQTSVLYDRQDRTAGESKYPLRQMIRLAMNGLTSFSTVPLALANWLAGSFGLTAALILLGNGLAGTVTTLTWLLVSLFIIGAGITATIGIMGSYLGRVFTASRRRPAYVIQATYGFEHPVARPATRQMMQG
ncbi:glycosyltransferase family 2 protein [Lacticaseibacillus absianus]|uniref:glycosyltransferase family 2 protein n=1 Tax=Lacticaseibacillus absianus TaxID=2729623 RepID=UPI0015CBB3E5|nr:glycosyltransferase family 2 protein [Lacticaseibacillus absianus]